MPLTVRPRTDSDLNALAHVLTAVHDLDAYPVEGVEDPRGWLTPSNPLGAWTAELDDAPVGHVALALPQPEGAVARRVHEAYPHQPGRIAEVVRLFVAPQARNHGAATALMHAVITHASKQQLTLGLEVLIKDTAAIRLYRSLGFVELGTQTHSSPAGEAAALLFGQPSQPRP